MILRPQKLGSRHREFRDSSVFFNRMRGVFRHVPADEALSDARGLL